MLYQINDNLSFILCDFVTLNTIFLFSMFLLRAYRPGLTAVWQQCSFFCYSTVFGNVWQLLTFLSILDHFFLFWYFLRHWLQFWQFMAIFVTWQWRQILRCFLLITGCVEVLLMHPLDLMKTRFQLQGNAVPGDPGHYKGVTLQSHLLSMQTSQTFPGGRLHGEDV